MLDLLLSILALAAGGMVLKVYAAAHPPLSGRDEFGFHFLHEAPRRPRDLVGGSPT